MGEQRRSSSRAGARSRPNGGLMKGVAARRTALAGAVAGALSLALVGPSAAAVSHAYPEAAHGHPNKHQRIALPQYTETNVPSELGYFTAFEQKLFQKNGLVPALNVVEPADTLAPLIAGKEPAAIISSPQLVAGIQEGAPLVAIGNLYNSLVFELWAAPSVKSAKAVRGQKVAITSTSGLFAQGLSQLLPRLGVPMSSVHLVSYGSIPDMLAGALSGNVTVIPAIPGATTVALRRKGWHEISNPQKDLGRSLVASVPIVTTRTEIKKHPSLLQRYVDAIVEGIKDVKRKPTVAFKVLNTSPYFTVDAGKSTKAADYAAYSFYRAAMPCVPSVHPAEFASTIDFIAKTQPAVKSLKMAHHIDNRFVAIAKSRRLGC